MCKRMKLFEGARIAVLILSLLLASARSVRAGEIEEAVARAAAIEYAKEQIKFQLAEYLNRHPHIVHSTSPTIGTDSLRFVSRVMAVYGFVLAKTDRDRAWSATYMVASPEPGTAAILIALQLADTILTLRAQSDLAQIQAETVKIQADTINVLTRVYKQEFEDQTRVLWEYEQSLTRAQQLIKALAAHPVAAYFAAEPSVAVPSEDELAVALGYLVDLSDELLRLEISSHLVAAIVRPTVVDVDPAQLADVLKANRSYDPLRAQVVRLQKALRYFFASSNSAHLKRQIEADLEPYAAELRVYKHCVSVMNAVSTKLMTLKQRPDLVAKETLADCQERFGLKGVSL